MDVVGWDVKKRENGRKERIEKGKDGKEYV